MNRIFKALLNFMAKHIFNYSQLHHQLYSRSWQYIGSITPEADITVLIFRMNVGVEIEILQLLCNHRSWNLYLYDLESKLLTLGHIWLYF